MRLTLYPRWAWRRHLVMITLWLVGLALIGIMTGLLDFQIMFFKFGNLLGLLCIIFGFWVAEWKKRWF